MAQQPGTTYLRVGAKPGAQRAGEACHAGPQEEALRVAREAEALSRQHSEVVLACALVLSRRRRAAAQRAEAQRAAEGG